jgi:hypothetical protein
VTSIRIEARYPLTGRVVHARQPQVGIGRGDVDPHRGAVFLDGPREVPDLFGRNRRVVAGDRVVRPQPDALGEVTQCGERIAARERDASADELLLGGNPQTLDRAQGLIEALGDDQRVGVGEGELRGVPSVELESALKLLHCRVVVAIVDVQRGHRRPGFGRRYGRSDGSSGFEERIALFELSGGAQPNHEILAHADELGLLLECGLQDLVRALVSTDPVEELDRLADGECIAGKSLYAEIEGVGRRLDLTLLLRERGARGTVPRRGVQAEAVVAETPFELLERHRRLVDPLQSEQRHRFGGQRTLLVGIELEHPLGVCERFFVVAARADARVGAHEQRIHIVGVELEDAIHHLDAVVVAAREDQGARQRESGIVEPLGVLDRFAQRPDREAVVASSDQRQAVAVQHLGLVRALRDQLLEQGDRSLEVLVAVLEQADFLERIRRATGADCDEECEASASGEESGRTFAHGGAV